ncbi:MAG: NADH-quinone oxidoreductase subunit J [Deltaproteobacteria bacterium]|nr:NADH-quinone oxidoreductase subunit J [Candidatus Anaeroferrophillus wilburensis]MBN2889983.1 NADH-quinone oxidoreductase subunit J [Deltaproteobacteria bacterium]
MILYQYLAEALFFAFILLTFIGGLLAVRSGILMHAVLGLAVSLLGVAGLYFYLGSPFLAMMQILIYIGAVCIMIVFGIMVGYTPAQLQAGQVGGKNLVLALSAAVTAFLLLLVALSRTVWVPAMVKSGDYSLAYLGESLLYQYCLAFELISVVLLTAIVGAIVLARGGREEHF